MRKTIIFTLALSLMTGTVVVAQDHWNEGPVWQCAAYRTLPGQFDNYMKYLRKHVAAVRAEGQKQGLVVDQRIFVQSPSDPTDWDVMFCTAYKNGSAALDYDAAIEKKWDAIVAKHSGTEDEEEQREMTKPRFEMRQFLGTNMMREVELKPIE